MTIEQDLIGAVRAGDEESCAVLADLWESEGAHDRALFLRNPRAWALHRSESHREIALDRWWIDSLGLAGVARLMPHSSTIDGACPWSAITRLELEVVAAAWLAAASEGQYALRARFPYRVEELSLRGPASTSLPWGPALVRATVRTSLLWGPSVTPAARMALGPEVGTAAVVWPGDALVVVVRSGAHHLADFRVVAEGYTLARYLEPR